MLLKKRLPLLIAALLAHALLAPLAQAGEPSEVVRKGIHGVLDILGQPDLKAPGKKAERRNRMRKVIHRYFDFEEMSRRSLARTWRKRTPEEKAEFIELFSYFMERNYARHAGKLHQRESRSRQGDHRRGIRQGQHRHHHNGQERGRHHLPLAQSGGEWRVYDVVVEGVSLIKNYRDQFRSIIRRTSYANLVKILRAKRDEG